MDNTIPTTDTLQHVLPAQAGSFDGPIRVWDPQKHLLLVHQFVYSLSLTSPPPPPSFPKNLNLNRELPPDIKSQQFAPPSSTYPRPPLPQSHHSRKHLLRPRLRPIREFIRVRSQRASQRVLRIRVYMLQQPALRLVGRAIEDFQNAPRARRMRRVDVRM